MIELTFSRSEREDIVLTEDDLFDFRFERDCFSGDTFELGGVSAKSIYMIIDNNTQRFPRGAFANSRVRLDIDGHFCGYFNSELPKRRSGVIELTVYDDMIKLDTEFPEDCEFPSLFWTVYAHCLLKAGLADHFSVENGDIFVLNALFNVGVISHEYTDYIYANSCRNVISGMAEWNGGFAYINDDGKLQVDVFSKEVSKTFYSGELMDFDYSDETVVFSKIKTSQKNKTYEMGDDSGYVLVINNQYIGYGLDDADFETYLGFIYDYYKDFSLTPMSFTLAEPDFSLKIGDRISVVDEEENVTVTGNISEITVSGNCSMTVTCGGFGNVSGVVNYNKSSVGQNNQTKAGAGVGKAVEDDPTCEYFNDYEANNITTYGIAAYHHVEGRGNSCGPGTACHAEGYGNFVRYGTGLHVEGSFNTLDNGEASSVGGKGNNAKNLNMSRVDGSGNKVDVASSSHILGSENTVTNSNESIICGKSNTVENSFSSLILGKSNKIKNGHQIIVQGNENETNFYVGEVLGNHNTVTPALTGYCYVYGENNVIKTGCVFAFGYGLESDSISRNRVMFGEYNVARNTFGRQHILLLLGNGTSDQKRSSCFAVDYNGNVYCNHIYETGTSNIEDYFANNPAPAAQAARTITSASIAGLPIVLLDHAPTAADLTGSECVFLQCDDTASVEGETTGIFRVTDIFAEKSLQ